MTGRESEVINALNILEEDLQSIHFLTGDPRRTSRSTGILLDFAAMPGACLSVAMAMACAVSSRSRFLSYNPQMASC